jgi:hypothetical protein
MKVMYIEWLDARGLEGRVNRKEAEEAGLLLVKTAGLLIGEDEEVVRVSMDYWSYADASDGHTYDTYREIEVIPKSGIQKRMEWEIGDHEG